MRTYQGLRNCLVLCFFLSAFIPVESIGGKVSPSLPVFPDAQGFGTDTIAGRGGEILKVTNLKCSGKGSLREALEKKGSRIVVFEVSGIINLSSDLMITEPYLTVAGQTAPTPGITLKGAGIRVETHDVLLQHLQIRVGDDPEGPLPVNRDAIQILNNSFNIVVDHISASWGIDEIGSTWGNVHDVTVSNSIFSEGLDNSSHPKGPHSKGFLIGDNSKRISLIGNIFAHVVERLPRVKGGVSALVLNNYAYNCGGSNFMVIGAPEGKTEVSVIGNVFENGPNTKMPSRAIAVTGKAASETKVFLKDNLSSQALYQGHQKWLVSSPPLWIPGLKVLPASSVKTMVLKCAGARPMERDAVDLRLIGEIEAGGGRIIDSQTEVGGWPKTPISKKTFHVPLDPHKVGAQGYTQVEKVLHAMANRLVLGHE